MNTPVEVCRLPNNIPIGETAGSYSDGGLYINPSSTTKRFGLINNFRATGTLLQLSNHKGVKYSGADFRESLTASSVTEDIEWEGEIALKKVGKKSVSFVIDNKGRVHKETFKYQHQRTKKEVQDCWYTQEEFKQFRADCKKEAISQQKTAYRENFSAVYEACKKGSFKSVTKQRAYVSAASCRGLEAIVYQPLQSDRKNLLVTVLKTQRALPETLSRDKQEEAIANASRFLSKQARQLARVLGSGDAAVVMANDRLTASKQTNHNLPQEFSN